MDKMRGWEQNLVTKKHYYHLCWWIEKYKDKYILILNDSPIATFESKEKAKTFRKFMLIPYMKKYYLSQHKDYMKGQL